MGKVGHIILTPGMIIKSPKGDKEWVVLGASNGTVKIASIHKTMQKSDKELMDWEKIS